MEKSERRSYTKAQRAAAVADVLALGVIEAAKKHGVPQSCVSRWAKDARVRRNADAEPSPLSAPTPEAKIAAPVPVSAPADAATASATQREEGAARERELHAPVQRIGL
jgi:transposase-like protein